MQLKDEFTLYSQFSGSQATAAGKYSKALMDCSLPNTNLTGGLRPMLCMLLIKFALSNTLKHIFHLLIKGLDFQGHEREQINLKMIWRVYLCTILNGVS